MVVMALCLGVLMDEYIFQIPAALSTELRNSSACLAAANYIQEFPSASEVPQVMPAPQSCLHFTPLRYNLLYAVPALSTAITAPFYQLLLRRFGTGVISAFSYTLSFLSMWVRTGSMGRCELFSDVPKPSHDTPFGWPSNTSREPNVWKICCIPLRWRCIILIIGLC